MSSVVSVDSGISFQLIKLPNTVGWTAPIQKSIQSVLFGLVFARCLCFRSADM